MGGGNPLNEKDFLKKAYDKNAATKLCLMQMARVDIREMLIEMLKNNAAEMSERSTIFNNIPWITKIEIDPNKWLKESLDKLNAQLDTPPNLPVTLPELASRPSNDELLEWLVGLRVFTESQILADQRAEEEKAQFVIPYDEDDDYYEDEYEDDDVYSYADMENTEPEINQTEDGGEPPKTTRMMTKKQQKQHDFYLSLMSEIKKVTVSGKVSAKPTPQEQHSFYSKLMSVFKTDKSPNSNAARPTPKQQHNFYKKLMRDVKNGGGSVELFQQYSSITLDELYEYLKSVCTPEETEKYGFDKKKEALLNIAYDARMEDPGIRLPSIMDIDCMLFLTEHFENSGNSGRGHYIVEKLLLEPFLILGKKNLI